MTAMRNVLLFIACCVMHFRVFGQAEVPTSPLPDNTVPCGELCFYGVDFSNAQVYGATESDLQFLAAFRGINSLLVSDPGKYNLRRLVNRDVAVYPVPADNLNDNMDFSRFRTYNPQPQKRDLTEVTASYELPHRSGTGMVFVAWLLNKAKAEAVYTVVVFDVESREILFESDVVSRAGGFGLRNYWANTVYDIIRSDALAKKISRSLK